MSFSDTFLYYPYIRIPEKMLVNALLFQDRIKRIIPEYTDLLPQDAPLISKEMGTLKAYLGYDFIEEADFAPAKTAVSEAFCRFIDEAANAKNAVAFEGLLGPNYKQHLNLKESTYWSSVRHFVYASKFDPAVFERLERIGWLSKKDSGPVCEMREQVCDLYMTVLACSIAKESGQPISTEVEYAEEITRDHVFRNYFAEFLPSVESADSTTQELCINVMLTPPGYDTGKEAVGLHNLLTVNQAAAVRSELEQHRKGFSACVEKLIGEIRANADSTIPDRINEVREYAIEYRQRIIDRAAQQLSAEQKDDAENFRSGISITIPLIGAAVDFVSGTGGIGGLIGAGVAAIVGGRKKQQEEPPSAAHLTDRQHAAVFMNRIWDLDRR